MSLRTSWVKLEVLTISLAGVIDPAEVFVAAALVGTLSVVADMGTHSELTALILICESPPRPRHTQCKHTVV